MKNLNFCATKNGFLGCFGPLLPVFYTFLLYMRKYKLKLYLVYINILAQKSGQSGSEKFFEFEEE